MPDPNKLLNTLAKAEQAFRATLGRRGRLVVLEAGAEVLVAGDLHGNLENFRKLLEVAQLAQNPKRHLILQELIHGPHRYPGGGDKSHQLIDLLAALKCQYPAQVHMLLGNHELSQATGRRIAKSDLDQNDLFRQGVGTAYGSLSGQVYAAYQRLFHALDLAVRAPNRIFLSHSLPSLARMSTFRLQDLEKEASSPEDLLPGGSAHSLVWGRDMRLEAATAFLQAVDADLLITGHIPCPKGYDVPNEKQIIIDSLGAPACFCLFATDRLLSQQDLLNCLKTL